MLHLITNTDFTQLLCPFSFSSCWRVPSTLFSLHEYFEGTRPVFLLHAHITICQFDHLLGVSFHVPTSLYFLETESYVKWLLYSLALLAGDFILHHLKSHPLSTCSTIRDANLSAIYKGATTILLLSRRFLPLSLVSDCSPHLWSLHPLSTQ